MVADIEALTQEALALPGNERCFDCDADCAADPWVSLTHATVICIECSGLHRSLGTHISFVRSVQLDKLKEAEVQALLRGGNGSFLEFLEDPARSVKRHVWLALPIEARYHTPAADLYRRRLRAAAEGAAELPDVLRRVPVPKPKWQALVPKERLSWASALLKQPAWTADADALRCELCKTFFAAWRRRHHCRRCGRCVCSSCSPEEGFRPLPELGYAEPCRHCKVCSPPAARTLPGIGSRSVSEGGVLATGAAEEH